MRRAASRQSAILTYHLHCAACSILRSLERAGLLLWCAGKFHPLKIAREDFMRLDQASAFALLLLLTATPMGSFGADLKSDVTAAYAAWDAAFNKGDAKILATAYLPNAKLL